MDIIKKLESVSGDRFAYDLREELFGESKIVHSEGDEEGGGEYSEVVRYFPALDVYVKLTGTYYSYDGTHWNDDYHLVKPVKKTIIVYE